MQKTVYVAKLVNEEPVITELKIMKETDKFVFYTNELKAESKLAKIADEQMIFDEYEQARDFLVNRMTDEQETLVYLAEKKSFFIELLKNSKEPVDTSKVTFAFDYIEAAESAKEEMKQEESIYRTIWVKSAQILIGSCGIFSNSNSFVL